MPLHCLFIHAPVALWQAIGVSISVPPPQRLAQTLRIQIDGKFFANARAPGRGESRSLRYIHAERSQTGRQRLHIARRDEAAGFPVLDQLADGRQIAADRAKAAGHGLHEHDGNAIAVAAGIHPAGQHEQVRLLHGVANGVVGRRARKIHGAVQTQPRGPKFGKDFWTAEVNKMVKVYGAPIEDADIPKIVEYLTQTYSTALQ